MKNIILILWGGLLLPDLVLAQSSLEVLGEAHMAAQAYILPTSQQGNLNFTVSKLSVDLQSSLSEGNVLVANIEGAERARDGSSPQFDIFTREIYLDLISPFQSMKALRLGLLPQTWQEAQYEDWAYEFLGNSGQVLTQRFGYLHQSDLGLSYMSQLSGIPAEWALTLTNGEGRGAETGPQKDVALFVRWTPSDSWTLSLNYVRGAYDGFGAALGLKERVQALALYRPSEDWLLGVELLDAHDPAEALRDFKMADEVDVSSFLGHNVHGYGGSLYVEFATGPLAKIVLRYDHLIPLANESDKDLSSWLAALAYQFNSDIRAALAYDYTRYGDNFAPGVRDHSKLELAAQVLF